MKILARSAWTSTHARGSAIQWSRIRGVVCHYPAAGRDIGVISQEAEAARLRGWRNYHVNGRGWSDIGYNYGISQAGRIWSLRGDRVGAHATGHNSTTVGILFIVGDNEPLTPAARAAAAQLIAHLRSKAAGRGLWGHQQMAGASTRCPGPYIMRDIRSGALTRGGTVPAQATPVTPARKKEWYEMLEQIREFRGEKQRIPARTKHNILRLNAEGWQYLIRGPLDYVNVTATVHAAQLPAGSVDLSIVEVVGGRITRVLSTVQHRGGKLSVDAAWKLGDDKGALAVMVDSYTDHVFEINWVELSGVKSA